MHEVFNAKAASMAIIYKQQLNKLIVNADVVKILWGNLLKYNLNNEVNVQGNCVPADDSSKIRAGNAE